jgi:hypothetical protein
VGKRRTLGTVRQLTELFAALSAVACGFELDGEIAPPDGLPESPVETPPAETLHPASGTELPCEANYLDGLTPNQPLDAYEQRQVCYSGGFTVYQTFGPSCSATTCANVVAMADEKYRPLGPVPARMTDVCQVYWIAMSGGELVYAGNQRALAPFLAPVDTLDEAQFLLGSCEKAWATDAGFVILTSHAQGVCPVLSIPDLVQVASDGTIVTLEQGEPEDTHVCIGRRPHGLRGTHGRRGVSAVGDHCARSAELEAASVVAFLELARSLQEHGAPAPLIERAVRAAKDEIRHTRTMTRLARRYDSEPRARRIDARVGTSLEALALENAMEGCVIETWGALVGSVQSRNAANATLRRHFARIAADETRHAALSWDLARWFDSKLDAPARARVATARQHAAERLLRDARREPDVSLCVELGLPNASAAERLARGLATALWRDEPRVA